MNKKKTGIIILALVSILFGFYNIAHNVDSIEKKTSKFNDCVQTEKNLKHNAEEINHLSDGYAKNELIKQHNLNVAEFNGACNGEIR